MSRNFWSGLDVVQDCSTVEPRFLLASSICALMTLLFGIPLSSGIVILPADDELAGSSFLGLNIYRSISECDLRIFEKARNLLIALRLPR